MLLTRPPQSFFCVLFFLWILSGNTQTLRTSISQKPVRPADSQVEDILQKLTPEEKFRQLFMCDGDLLIGRKELAAGIFGLRPVDQAPLQTDRLQKSDQGCGPACRMANRINQMQDFFLNETRAGIPVVPFDEALHGLMQDGATSFPQAIGLAATFDTSLMHQVARAIAAETRSRGIRQVLSPVLNIARDVRWGRTEETYGEDPYLVSLMGHAFVSEISKAGIIATPKHFAVNVGDGGRDSYPVHYSHRLMEELYFPAFRVAVREAGAMSVMTAYNSFDGIPCTSNSWLLNDKLKRDWSLIGRAHV